jgi:hypothetical protein
MIDSVDIKALAKKRELGVNIKTLADRHGISVDEAFDTLYEYGQETGETVLMQVGGECHYTQQLEDEMVAVSPKEGLVIPKAEIEKRVKPIEAYLTPRSSVYFLYDEAELVYIGQSTNIPARIASHMRDKTFDSVAVFPVESGALRVEAANIRHYKPKYNKAGVANLVNKLDVVLDKLNAG